MWEHESFATGLQDEFVFVYLDFPSSEEVKALVPNPERNKELAGQYGVRGYPTVLLMTAKGEVFGTTGYKNIGPEEYVTHVKELVAPGKAALAKIEAFAKEFAAAEDKAVYVQKALDMLATFEEGAIGGATLATLVRKAYAIDPENEAGLKLKALKLLLEKGYGDAADLKLAKSMDPKNENGLFERVIFAGASKVQDDTTANAFVDEFKAFLDLGAISDKTRVQELCAATAGWCDRMLDRPEDAVLLAKKAQELGELEGRMKAAVDAILNKPKP